MQSRLLCVLNRDDVNDDVSVWTTQAQRIDHPRCRVACDHIGRSLELPNRR